MSLVSTLAKVAVGVAVAKGVSSLAKGGTSRSVGGAGGGSITDMLGEMMGGAQTGARPGNVGGAGGGLADILGQLAGGGAARGAAGGAGGGGLADILGQLAGGGTTRGAAGRTAGGGTVLDQLGQMMGGSAGGVSGGLGGLLDSLGGGAAAGGLGGLINASLQGDKAPKPTQAQEDQAGLLLRAMIQAAKSDGRIDQAEKEALTKHLGDIGPAEARVIEDAFAAPVDIDTLARATPKGMEAQVYMMSLIGLDLDSQAEAQYLHGLAQKLGLDPKTANAIHQKMGEPALYS